MRGAQGLTQWDPPTPNCRASSSWLTNCPGGSTRSWMARRTAAAIVWPHKEPHVSRAAGSGASRDPSSRVHRVGTGRSAFGGDTTRCRCTPAAAGAPSEAVPTGRARKNLQKLSGSHWRVSQARPSLDRTRALPAKESVVTLHVIVDSVSCSPPSPSSPPAWPSRARPGPRSGPPLWSARAAVRASAVRGTGTQAALPQSWRRGPGRHTGSR